MRVPLRSIHLYGGWLFVLIFTLTGVYMRTVIHPAMKADPVLRYSIRANHVDILLLGLLHLCLGAYWRPSESSRNQKLQVAGSALLLFATVMVIAAFFLEPKVGPDRPVLTISIVVAVLGVASHLMGVRE